MPAASDNKFPKVILEERATDGSDTSNPAADHRALFLGEDGGLHLRDSSGTVTDVSSGAIDWGETGDITDQDYDDVADAGVLNEAARADHLHGMPSAGGGSELAYGAVHLTGGDFTGTSNSFADVTGASVTETTGARRCRITVIANGGNDSAGDLVALDVNIDGTRMGGDFGLMIQKIESATTNYSFNFSVVTDVLTAASHTFKLQYRRSSAGTVTVRAGTVTPLKFQVEELPITA